MVALQVDLEDVRDRREDVDVAIQSCINCVKCQSESPSIMT